MADSDSILGRLGSNFQDAFEEARKRDDARREAALEATARAARWAGLVRDPDFLRTNAWRGAHFARAAEQTASVASELEVALAGARRLADPAADDAVRIFGRIDSPEGGGEADVIDAEGCAIASSPIDPLGGYAIVTKATGEEARLEIRDAKGQRAVLDGRPFELTPGLALRRDFATGRCGKVEPKAPEEPAEKLEMPDLVGKPVEDARAALGELGAFRIAEARRPDDAPKDTVTDQTPAPRQPLRNGALILLAVSGGAEDPQEMPDLVGATEAEALKTLSALAYRTVRFTQVRDPKRAGTIAEQSPEPGAELAPTTDITLCLAVEALLMPRVTGLTRKEAMEILVPAYVEAPRIEEEPDGGAPDRVLDQRPRTGEAIEDGVALKISISKGPKDDTLTMPRVLGMTRARAIAALVPRYAGEIAFDRRPERGRAGLVVAQHPNPGTKDPKDIRLTLSEPITEEGSLRMPELRGKPLDVARKTLKPITDSVEIEKRPDKTAPGTVLDQRPAPGQPVGKGATLIVSVPPEKDEEKKSYSDAEPKDRATRLGSRPRATATALPDMPDLSGLTLARARKALSRAGLGEPNYDSGAARKRGNRIVEQSPAPGTPVSPDDDIDLGFDKPGKDGPGKEKQAKDGPA